MRQKTQEVSGGLKGIRIESGVLFDYKVKTNKGAHGWLLRLWDTAGHGQAIFGRPL